MEISVSEAIIFYSNANGGLATKSEDNIACYIIDSSPLHAKVKTLLVSCSIALQTYNRTLTEVESVLYRGGTIHDVLAPYSSVLI